MVDSIIGTRAELNVCAPNVLRSLVPKNKRAAGDAPDFTLMGPPGGWGRIAGAPAVEAIGRELLSAAQWPEKGHRCPVSMSVMYAAKGQDGKVLASRPVDIDPLRGIGVTRQRAELCIAPVFAQATWLAAVLRMMDATSPMTPGHVSVPMSVVQRHVAMLEGEGAELTEGAVLCMLPYVLNEAGDITASDGGVHLLVAWPCTTAVAGELNRSAWRLLENAAQVAAAEMCSTVGRNRFLAELVVTSLPMVAKSECGVCGGGLHTFVPDEEDFECARDTEKFAKWNMSAMKCTQCRDHTQDPFCRYSVCQNGHKNAAVKAVDAQRMQELRTRLWVNVFEATTEGREEKEVAWCAPTHLHPLLDCTWAEWWPTDLEGYTCYRPPSAQLRYVDGGMKGTVVTAAGDEEDAVDIGGLFEREVPAVHDAAQESWIDTSLFVSGAALTVFSESEPRGGWDKVVAAAEAAGCTVEWVDRKLVLRSVSRMKLVLAQALVECTLGLPLGVSAVDLSAMRVDVSDVQARMWLRNGNTAMIAQRVMESMGEVDSAAQKQQRAPFAAAFKVSKADERSGKQLRMYKPTLCLAPSGCLQLSDLDAVRMSLLPQQLATPYEERLMPLPLRVGSVHAPITLMWREAELRGASTMGGADGGPIPQPITVTGPGTEALIEALNNGFGNQVSAQDTQLQMKGGGGGLLNLGVTGVEWKTTDGNRLHGLLQRKNERCCPFLPGECVGCHNNNRSLVWFTLFPFRGGVNITLSCYSKTVLPRVKQHLRKLPKSVRFVTVTKNGRKDVDASAVLRGTAVIVGLTQLKHLRAGGLPCANTRLEVHLPDVPADLFFHQEERSDALLESQRRVRPRLSQEVQPTPSEQDLEFLKELKMLQRFMRGCDDDANTVRLSANVHVTETMSAQVAKLFAKGRGM